MNFNSDRHVPVLQQVCERMLKTTILHQTNIIPFDPGAGTVGSSGGRVGSQLTSTSLHPSATARGLQLQAETWGYLKLCHAYS